MSEIVEYTGKIDDHNINEYKVLLRSKGVTHMTLLMYAPSREELAKKLGSQIITMGDVVVMMGDEIDEITVVK